MAVRFTYNNQGGLVDRYINTSYDIVKIVSDNIGQVLTVGADIANVNIVEGYITGGQIDDAIAAAVTTASDLSSVQTIYDLFDDTYLGSKAADPSLDNDGNALAEGALYWNSVSNEMRVYNGAAFVVSYMAAQSGISDSAPGISITLDASNNVIIGGMAIAASSDLTLHISDVTTAPTGNPTAGVAIYSEGAVLKVRDTNGIDFVSLRNATEILVNKTLTSPTIGDASNIVAATTSVLGVTRVLTDSEYQEAASGDTAKVVTLGNLLSNGNVTHYKYCTTDTTLNNSGSLTNVTGMGIESESGARYAVEACLILDQADGAAGIDLQIQGSATASVRGEWTCSSNATLTRDIQQSGTDSVAVGTDTYAYNVITFKGTLYSTGGDTQLQVRFAQSTPTVADTTIKAGSWVKLTMMSAPT